MTTQVYYRKWRPGSFAELVGQEHATTTLRQAVKQERVSHSYLFCGPRGSGKTTTARIIAKAVNCLEPQDGDPCNNCAICTSINEGRFMDIIELDAASNRGIDEIRDIREKVNFAPAQGRRKVYIIDEAHMLTEAASNAFLKTLEEPPGHVIFVLCTTESHKILPTIISRCQRFDFRRIPSELIYGRLSEVAAAEGVGVEPEALRLIARFAAGSLRDAENLLEQLVVSHGDGVNLGQVEDLLGLGHTDRWLELVKYLLMGNVSASLGVINQAAWDGTDLRQLQRQVLDLLRSVLLLQWEAAESVDLPEDIIAELKQLVGQLPPWRIVKAVKTWGEANLRHDAPSTLPLELAVVEICQEPAPPAAQPTTQGMAPPPREAVRPTPRKPTPRASGETSQPKSQSAEPQSAEPQSSDAPAAQQLDEPTAETAGENPTPAAVPSGVASEVPSPAAAVAPLVVPFSEGGDFAASWAAAVKALSRHKGKKYNLGALLRDCRADAISVDGNTLGLAFSHRANMERMQEEMEEPASRSQVGELIAQFLGQTYEIKITLMEGSGSGAAGPRSAQSSPLVRAAMGMGARILEEVPE